MDFHYQAAHAWYINLDKLIKYTNEGTARHGVRLLYSTPTCYLKALHDEGLMWPEKSDDFFPYASDPHAYWTGYFTSRPTSKGMIRETSSILTTAKQLAAKNSSYSEATEALGRAVAVTQHHDAITGTEKQQVAYDYHLRLDRGVQDFMKIAAPEIGEFCPLLNISQCSFTESSAINFTVHVYNPRAQTSDHLIRIPVQDPGWKVIDASGNDVVSQVNRLPSAVKKIPGRQSTADYEVAFRATNLTAIGTTLFKFRKTENPSISRRIDDSEGIHQRKLALKCGAGNVFYYDQIVGTLHSLGHFRSGEIFEFKQEYLFYLGHAGTNIQFDDRASGAYIFRPQEQGPTPVGLPQVSEVYTGDLYHEIYNVYDHNVSQVMRIPRWDNPLFDVEVEWLVGPIVADPDGKEYIHRVKVDDINNNGIFYTDSNGRQVVERKRDFRPSYEIPDAPALEPVTSNYYPVVSSLHIENDKKMRLTMVTDRSQGGGSIHDGEVELMIHRRLMYDDAFGVQEPLDEFAFGQPLVARGKHYLLFDSETDDANFRRRKLTNNLYNAPLVTFKESHEVERQETKIAPFDLPENINLLSLEPLSGEKVYLIRIEHFFAKGEHSKFSNPVIVNLQELILNLGLGKQIASIKETTLGGMSGLTREKGYLGCQKQMK